MSFQDGSENNLSDAILAATLSLVAGLGVGLIIVSFVRLVFG
jgi:hypothetical protein